MRRLFIGLLFVLTSPLVAATEVADKDGNTLLAYYDGEIQIILTGAGSTLQNDVIDLGGGVTGVTLSARVHVQINAFNMAKGASQWPGAMSDWATAVNLVDRTWRKGSLEIDHARYLYSKATIVGSYMDGIARKAGIVVFDTTMIDNAITACDSAITHGTAAGSVTAETSIQTSLSASHGISVTTTATVLKAIYVALRDDPNFTAGVHNDKVFP